MNKNKKYYLAKTKVQPNTFIGGVSATINTAALVASKLGISASRIKAFSVVDNDIQFAVIGGSYSIPFGAWNGNSSITYYKDMEGLVTSIGGSGFKSASNLAELNLPNCTVVNADSVMFCYSLLILNMPELTTCNGLTNNDASFRDLPVQHLYFPKLINAASAFYGAKFITFSAPLLTNIGTGCFQQTVNATTINVPNLQTIGTPSDNINAFNSTNGNCNITVHLSIMINNDGQPDADILACTANIIYDGYVSDNSYDVEIGGVHLTLNTKKLIAAKLGLNASALENFQIVPDAIRFKVLVHTYQVSNGAFASNTAITSFKDFNGKCIKFNYRAFRGTINLAEVIAPAVIEIVDECFHDINSLISLSLPSLITISGSFTCITSTVLTSLNFPSLNNVTITGSVVRAPLLNSINTPSLSVMNINPSGQFVSGNNECANGVNITISSAALTSNGGTIDADLQALITNKGAVVTYV